MDTAEQTQAAVVPDVTMVPLRNVVTGNRVNVDEDLARRLDGYEPDGQPWVWHRS